MRPCQTSPWSGRGERQAWPISRRLLVARHARDVIAPPKSAGKSAPIVTGTVDILGRISAGTPNRSSKPSSQSPLPIAISAVRTALLASLTCSPRRQAEHQIAFDVPTARCSPAACNCGQFVSAQPILDPKNRDQAAARFWPEPPAPGPSAFRLAHMSAVRRSCQTIARAKRFARSLVPEHNRFALVGNPDGSNSLAAPPAARHLARAFQRQCPKFRWHHVQPDRGQGNAASADAARSIEASRPRQTTSPVWMSCLHRSRGESRSFASVPSKLCRARCDTFSRSCSLAATKFGAGSPNFCRPAGLLRFPAILRG